MVVSTALTVRISNRAIIMLRGILIFERGEGGKSVGRCCIVPFGVAGLELFRF